MKKLLEIAAIFICFLLQSTLFQYLSFAGIVPNLMIIITSVFGFIEGRDDGMFVGFTCGLLTDIFYGQVLGVNALIFLLIGYLNGVANRGFYPDDIKFPMLFISISDFASLILTYLSSFLLRARFAVGYYFLHVMLPELLYTIIVAIIIYFPLQKVVLAVDGRYRESE